MNDTSEEHYRALIEARLGDLEREDRLGQSGQATVTLDQQAVGRLSRQDALQNQAMAKATHARRQTERKRLTAALARIDAGEFGFCDSCGEAIAPGRLALDPAATRCVECARG
ncbi:TraR/DksA family transcriptional regulator [Roseovarius halotolerans]|uniref:RNA polymerase-binding transcription factor n=1 Tax=Roseovarius halotolerans TaxID=505353 RepID=A0A1X6YIA9_9RHOB|nr:TraR/DksA C4-type zinc finger protein [Roseovarius halotolerans]RKT34578.1 TraR/DksA family transcriptional regulator [Roseovarius halotolerans]SLN21798.1 RNA polymerase-binding transcription factor [Roseovarius halotolerans]